MKSYLNYRCEVEVPASESLEAPVSRVSGNPSLSHDLYRYIVCVPQPAPKAQLVQKDRLLALLTIAEALGILPPPPPPQKEPPYDGAVLGFTVICLARPDTSNAAATGSDPRLNQGDISTQGHRVILRQSCKRSPWECCKNPQKRVQKKIRRRCRNSYSFNKSITISARFVFKALLRKTTRSLSRTALPRDRTIFVHRVGLLY